MLTLATTKNRNDVSKNSDNDEHLTRNNNNNKIQELLQAPEKFAMLQAQEEMKNVWNRSDLSEDEKVKYYTNEMNTFKTLHRSLTTPRPIEMKFVANDGVDEAQQQQQQKLKSPATAAVASPARAGPPLEKSLKMDKEDYKIASPQ